MDNQDKMVEMEHQEAQDSMDKMEPQVETEHQVEMEKLADKENQDYRVEMVRMEPQEEMALLDSVGNPVKEERMDLLVHAVVPAQLDVMVKMDSEALLEPQAHFA